MEEDLRILIIDDDPAIRLFYKGILMHSPKEDTLSEKADLFREPLKRTERRDDSRPYELTLVDRGEEGIKAVEKAVAMKNPIAVAFIDMIMPGLNGAETSKAIWAVDPAIKIVIVTGYSKCSPTDIVQITERDGIFYLRKPFNPEEIRQFARALTNQWILEREREQLSLEVKKANEALRAMNLNLKREVEDQAALLVQSEKMASIGILTAGIAHEINNPIFFINGNLSTLKDYHARIFGLLERYRELDTLIESGDQSGLRTLCGEIKKFREDQRIDFTLEDSADLVEESLEGVSRISNIVKDMKNFSRMDQAELKHIDIHESIDAAINIIWNELKHKTEVIKDYGNVPPVKCFPQKIGQVFMNILLNAAQAIEEKGIITISTRKLETGRRLEDKCVQIRISDTGRGIPKEQISRIFDPFFTTKPVGQGTGLGLSITYDIIKAHGGKIVVETVEGKGTTFTLRLPIEAKPEDVLVQATENIRSI